MTSFSATGLIVFCALLGSAFSHRCYECMTANSKTCNPIETECIGSRCMTVSQYFQDDKHIFHSMYKGCANETMCGKQGMVTGKQLKFMGLIKCCNGDLCNNDEFQTPAENNTKNGLKCPFAYCKGSTEDCTPVEWKSCTGIENTCFEYRGEMSIPDESVGSYSLRGCSNPISCVCNFNVAIGINEIRRVALKCNETQPVKE
ncbi:phospholipase A2 inhibitor and Ly6/PLAUR domain-containing protein-like [Eleutherodactylus coqui]|uniref:phospholipase A2 inhibitor and Ly6/PLAUR domain-containing protein-like n=1 Tax=Eleutherodactylus coqui TaxID=57060 RepID=UPI003461B0DA